MRAVAALVLYLMLAGPLPRLALSDNTPWRPGLQISIIDTASHIRVSEQSLTVRLRIDADQAGSESRAGWPPVGLLIELWLIWDDGEPVLGAQKAVNLDDTPGSLYFTFSASLTSLVPGSLLVRAALKDSNSAHGADTSVIEYADHVVEISDMEAEMCENCKEECAGAMDSVMTLCRPRSALPSSAQDRSPLIAAEHAEEPLAGPTGTGEESMTEQDVPSEEGPGQSDLETKAAIFRYLKPETIDDVVADPAASSKEALASALAWTRLRESKLLRQVEALRAQVETLRSQSSVAAGRLGASNVTDYDNFCAGAGSRLQELSAEDAAYEGNGESLRLDGIVQTHRLQDKVQVSLCLHEDQLSGIFRIQKRFDCDETISFTDDASYESEIRNSSGPDDFVLVLEGYELFSPTPDMRYRGSCVYDLPFSVRAAGWYHINLVWCRENYIGAREGVSGWLPAHLDKPLGERSFVQLGASPNQGALEAEASMLELHRDLNLQSLLPACNLRSQDYSYIPGRWVFKGSPGMPEMRWVLNGVNPRTAFDNPPLYARKVGDSFLHTWVPSDKFTWLPSSCSLPEVSPDLALQCLEGKRVTFQGDSHMRQLYEAVVSFACQAGPDVWKSKKYDFWKPRVCGGPCVGNLHGVCYIRDTSAETSNFPDADADLVFINFGQHFCSGEGQKSFRDYAVRVDQVVERVRNMSTTARKKIVWHETNMQPLRKDPWVQGYGDQRTNTKLKHYNQYATRQMQGLGVPVIPAFSQTLPLFTSSWGEPVDEPAHIPVKYLFESSVKFVLALLCEEE